MAGNNPNVTAAVNAFPPMVFPPAFFGIVESEVYRSKRFDSSSFSFLKPLKLKTLVHLSSEELSHEVVEFLHQTNVNVINLGAKHSLNSHWKFMSEELTKDAIELILDQTNHPIMVMCNTGTHLTGTIIGCLRRLLNWSLTSIIDKYRNQAGSAKTLFENEQFIELFDVDLITLPENLPGWFLLNQELMEKEMVALKSGQFFPEVSIDIPKSKSIPAYQRYYFDTKGPLTSPSVKFSEKKSIIGDDEGD